MRTLSLMLLGVCLTIGALSVRQTVAAIPQALVMELTAPDKQREALMQIRALADPALQEVLQALKEGALYLWQGETLLILNDTGTLVDLEGKPLLDSAGQPLMPTEGLAPVELETANMSAVQRALEAIELFGPDAAKRKSIALRWGNIQDFTVIPMLEKAQAQETAPAVKAVLIETIYKLSLIHI